MKKTLHIVPQSGGECCDFCTAEPIQKLYRCGNFLWQRQSIFPHGSVGEWAACRECAELIDNEKWSSLTERSLRYFLRRHTDQGMTFRSSASSSAKSTNHTESTGFPSLSGEQEYTSARRDTAVAAESRFLPARYPNLWKVIVQHCSMYGSKINSLCDFLKPLFCGVIIYVGKPTLSLMPS